MDPNSYEAKVLKAEQAIRMLNGVCPHNRPDTDAPRNKGECITCIAEAAITALEEK